MHRHDHRKANDARDRSNVANEIEIEVIVERRVDCIRCAGEKQRVAVWLRAHYRLGSKIATGAISVLHYERLTESFRKPLSHQARDDVGGTTWDGTDDETHWASGIGLCPGEARDGRSADNRLLNTMIEAARLGARGR